MYHCGSCMNSYRHRQSLSRHKQKCEGEPLHDSGRQSHEENCLNPKMEVDDSTEDVQLTDRYEPREKCIGSYSLNPKQNIYSNDGSRVKDEYSDESSMKELCCYLYPVPRMRNEKGNSLKTRRLRNRE